MMQGITIFDFDRSVTFQDTFLRNFKHLIMTRPMSSYQRVARLWSSVKNFQKVSSSMQLENTCQFVLLGSGDYHHLSLALLAQHTTPFTLVLFDNHPDWMRPPHKYHCGSWVYTAARMTQIERIVIIGLENGDLAGKNFLDGDVDSYFQQKIVLLPYLPINALTQHSQPLIRLESKLKVDLSDGIQQILDSITTKDVYISIDKDCLREQDAITNWEQGTLPLDVVLKCISTITTHHNLVGADTVGDYSPPVFTSPLKWIGSLFDRPSNALRMNLQHEANELNAITNTKLATVLGCI